ncbi:unnamed protein product [Onchocerca ochengi]|uniref:Uncharacterized protein n=1 Tax=Onchocerca ochengi TaxID=42157 RepID=A0A182EQH2_ONCOC|nr:unnamed protein product [Onchocerca ochengi]
MWKKSGAWFYNEIPEYIRPMEESASQSSSPYHLKNAWQHYTKPETSNFQTFSSNKSQQSRREQYGSTVYHRNRINASWLHDKVRRSLSNDCTSEDENAENSASEEIDVSSIKGSLSNRPNRIKKRTEAQDMPIVHRFAVGNRNRNRITDNEGIESHHATPSTSSRHSVSSYGDDLLQNQSLIVASEFIDSGADVMNPLTMIANVDGSNKLLKYSNYPQSSTTSPGIQKLFPSPEMRTTLESFNCLPDPETPSSQLNERKFMFPTQQGNKRSKKIFENEDILLKSQLEKIFPLMTSVNEQSSIATAESQCDQQDQFLKFSSSRISSPLSPPETMILVADLSKQQVANPECAESSASSASSARKSVMSLESLPTNLENFKTKETAPSYKFDSDDCKKVEHWQQNLNSSMQQSPVKRLSTAQSAMSLQSSVNTESILTVQAIRNAISGNEINNFQNSNAGP